MRELYILCLEDDSWVEYNLKNSNNLQSKPKYEWINEPFIDIFTLRSTELATR